MQRVKSVLAILVTVFILFCGGCATLSKQQCLEGDWFGVGYKDGVDGYTKSRLQEHKQACLEYSILPDEGAYRSGWNHGLTIYCTEQNGFKKGRIIAKYKGSCPSQLEQHFLRGYLQGLDSAENDLYRSISRKQRDLVTSALVLQNLKGEDYKKQVKKFEQLERELKAEEDKLLDINRLRIQYGHHHK